mgnify:FL=1
MFTDTHCHLYKEYYEDISKILLNAQEASITRFIVAGCDNKSNKEVLELTKKYPSIYGALGIHPENVQDFKSEDLTFLEKALQNKKVIAIGEIGLDYHYGKEDKESQKKLFESQLCLAEKYHLPVVIHSRDATQDTVDILKKYPLVKGVIHSFSGSLEVAKIYIKMGYKLGINGVVTFKNSHLKELLPYIKNDIILETDSPYLTPHPYRGTRNEPKYVKNIAEFVSEYLNVSIEELSEITNKNILSLFDI